LRLLLDTHILLWALAEQDKLPRSVAALLIDPANSVLSSTVAIWEIAIKHARNRGRQDDMPINGQQALVLSETAGIILMDATPDHAAALDELPLYHRDPFDRLLVAQARFEEMTLITHDKTLARYGDFVMVV
jgi:PIN domain nuclease of toxin-antitoxin system